MTVIIELYSFPVKGNDEEVIVPLVIAECNTYGCDHKGILNGIIVFKDDIFHHLFASYGNTFIYDAELLGKLICIALYLTSASDNEYCADGSVSVKSFNLIGDLGGHIIDIRDQGFINLICGNLLGKSHDISKFNGIMSLFDTLFYCLCHIEIDETFLNDHFGKGITCGGDHSVCNDASVPCDGDIRGSRTDIHESQIKESEFLGDRNTDSRNRLQCQIGDTESREFNSLVQAVKHIIRKKSSDKIRSYLTGFMSLGISYLISVQIITYGCITDQIEFHIRIIDGLEFRISLLYTRYGQIVDIFFRDLFFRIVFKRYGNGNSLENSSCGCYADFGEFFSDLCFESFFYHGYGLADLDDVMDLSVKHGSRRMFNNFLGNNMKTVIGSVAYSSDDASCSDIKSENITFPVF